MTCKLNIVVINMHFPRLGVKQLLEDRACFSLFRVIHLHFIISPKEDAVVRAGFSCFGRLPCQETSIAVPKKRK